MIIEVIYRIVFLMIFIGNIPDDTQNNKGGVHHGRYQTSAARAAVERTKSIFLGKTQEAAM